MCGSSYVCARKMRSAMTEDDMPLTRREALSLFPETILREVVEDDRFREVLDLKLDGMIVFDGDKARFGRAAFFDAIRELYRSGDASATAIGRASVRESGCTSG